ncbi:MAG TPA: hypothetical protein VMV92_17035 [Streptosporangiaceae bacterium]|nr:hypothetical protein [Streptosporangiaceae bacterium]
MTTPGRFRHVLGADDREQLELAGGVAAGLRGVRDDMQVAAADGEHVAVQGDRAQLRMVHRPWSAE